MDLLLLQFYCNDKCDRTSHKNTKQKHLYVIALFLLFVL